MALNVNWLAFGALALGCAALGATAADSSGVPWLVMAGGAGLAAGAERFGTRLGPGSRASGSFLAILGTAAAVGPLGGGVAGVAAAIAGYPGRGRPINRLALNVGSLALAGIVAGLILQVGGTGFVSTVIVGAAATLVSVLVTGLLVGLALGIELGWAQSRQFLTSLVLYSPTYLVAGIAAVLLAREAEGEGLAGFIVLAVLLAGGCEVARASGERIARRLRPGAAAEQYLAKAA